MNMNTQYAYGALVRVTVTFSTITGAAVDPTTVKVQTYNPHQTIATYIYGTDAALTKSATGVYTIDIDANVAGTWYVRGVSTGTGQAAQETQFTVTESMFD